MITATIKETTAMAADHAAVIRDFAGLGQRVLGHPQGALFALVTFGFLALVLLVCCSMAAVQSANCSVC